MRRCSRSGWQSAGTLAIAAPLTTITFAKGQIPLNGVQALVVTSKNALRALARSPSLAKAIELPIFTVGPGSGAMAAELGFERIIPGPASARELVPVIAARGEPMGRPLLVLTGDRPAFNMTERLGGTRIYGRAKGRLPHGCGESPGAWPHRRHPIGRHRWRHTDVTEDGRGFRALDQRSRTGRGNPAPALFLPFAGCGQAPRTHLAE